MFLTCFSMFCVLHVLCVVSCGDAASWCLTPVTRPVSCRGCELMFDSSGLGWGKEELFVVWRSFWGSRCVNVVACPVFACHGMCRPTSVPVTWLCWLWKYTAMACGTQVLCTCKKRNVCCSVEIILCTCHACSVFISVLVTCWSPRFSDLFLDHHVMFFVCDLCRRPGKLCDACLRTDSLHCVFI